MHVQAPHQGKAPEVAFEEVELGTSAFEWAQARLCYLQGLVILVNANKMLHFL